MYLNDKYNYFLIKRFLISMIIVISIMLLNYLFMPVSIISVNFDKTNIDNYLVEDKQSFIFTLNGVKIKEKPLTNCTIYYSEKTNKISTVTINNKKNIIIPSFYKNLSLYNLQKKLLEEITTGNIHKKTDINIDYIRQHFQKINFDEVMFYEMDGMKRIKYKDIDTFKMVVYSYKEEVSEIEIYWNKDEAYFYIITPRSFNEVYAENINSDEN